MKYLIAEKFKSLQGEGVYTGTPMAFIRFVGCSVGKSICSACDTDFEQPVTWRGGGEFSAEELFEWSRPYSHVCLTGGEPFDQDLSPIFSAFSHWHDPDGTGYHVDPPMLHIETSGTKNIVTPGTFGLLAPSWVCISPKPGFIEEGVLRADEVKVIMPGLGVLKNGVMQPAVRSTRGDSSVMAEGLKRGATLHEDGTIRDTLRWPDLSDALRWADAGKTVFLQPRNGRADIDMNNLRLCQDIIAEHPQLRLSMQLHKLLRVQ
jgi:7-carboxy-7-deazaguanine synthase